MHNPFKRKGNIMTEQPKPEPQPEPQPEPPVNPEVQAALDKEARADDDRRAVEADAQNHRKEREAREAEELSQDDRVKVALNQRVEPRDEATFLAATGHNTDDSE